MFEFEIKEAQAQDIGQICDIYAASVASETASWEYDAPSVAEMKSRYNAIKNDNFPYFVAKLGGKVLGFAYANHYRTRIGYRFCVEDSIYIDDAYKGHGIGKALLVALIDDCRKRGFKQMIAVIGDSENKASIALHEKCGFVHIGTLPEIGYKFDKWLDSVIMQLKL